MGYVYIIAAKNTDLHKIGITSRPPKTRLSELQTSCPHELILGPSFEMESPQKAEGIIHDLLSDYRTTGEWFELPDRKVMFACKKIKELKERQHLFQISQYLQAISELKYGVSAVAYSIIFRFITMAEPCQIVKSLIKSNVLEDSTRRKLQAKLQNSAEPVESPF